MGLLYLISPVSPNPTICEVLWYTPLHRGARALHPSFAPLTARPSGASLTPRGGAPNVKPIYPTTTLFSPGACAYRTWLPFFPRNYSRLRGCAVIGPCSVSSWSLMSRCAIIVSRSGANLIKPFQTGSRAICSCCVSTLIKLLQTSFGRNSYSTLARTPSCLVHVFSTSPPAPRGSRKDSNAKLKSTRQLRKSSE